MVCSQDPQLGDSCETSSDCPDDCETGGSFPGGICTHECLANEECPAGWACVSDRGGICLKECSSTADCADAFGDQWICDTIAHQTDPGNVDVCQGL